MKIKKALIISSIALLSLLILFFSGTFIFHKVKTSEEAELLREAGYYNLVSIGDYSLNVADFGNKEGKHTIVGIAGLGSGDFSVAMRKMTKELEIENRVVFVDRAGYGFSEDTDKKMTLENIVEDYRKALINAGIKAPYILMPHSIGGAYANYWASNYPEEIEAIVFIDGSQLSETAFEDEEAYDVGFTDKFLSFMAKAGMSRYVLRDYFYHYPDNYSEEEQLLADALSLMTLDSLAPVSEAGLLAENAQAAFNGIVTNNIPKLYICSSWGFKTSDEVIEHFTWTNRQVEINNMDSSPFPTDYESGKELVDKLLRQAEELQRDIIVPYAEKMGNCKIVYLGGDHMIYEQKPEECGRISKEFIDSLKAS